MLPAELIASLQGVPGFDGNAFLQVHEGSIPPVSIRKNGHKWSSQKHSLFDLFRQVPWASSGFYLHERPVFTLDPWLHAGAYYVQEASSMFLEIALKKVTAGGQPLMALDLCAAPGGKSTHLLGLLPSGSVLVSNEVIKTRVSILLENIIKWGSAHSMVTQNDPADFGRLGPVFDLLVVDAPCSGSGLFRRDADAIKEWSAQAVELCAQRQQRILADALPSLKEGGYLVYSTCSYSPREDEDILRWLTSEYGMEGIDLEWPDGKHGVVLTAAGKVPAYRFFPDKVKGEGFFLALLKKSEIPGGLADSGVKKAIKQKDTPIPAPLKDWLKDADQYLYYQHQESCYAMPPEVYRLFHQLKHVLNIRKAGVKMAEQVHQAYNPVHDFALFEGIEKKEFTCLNTGLQEALTFLRKDDLRLSDQVKKGWVLVMYEDLPIGWVKNLGIRSNNYYPKDWRIKMKG